MTRPRDKAATAGAGHVPVDIKREDCPVESMRRRLPADATPVTNALPPLRKHVLGWLSDPEVCIYFKPAIVWRTPGWSGVAGEADEWWSGLPGNYINLQRYRWHLSHWMPIAALSLATPPSQAPDNSGDHHV